jgi:hypothetical protein
MLKGGAPHVPPSKSIKKLGHKNAIKHKNKGPIPHNPNLSCPNLTYYTLTTILT